VVALTLALAAPGAWAETVRVAMFNVALSRTGPGVLLKELRRGDDPQIAAVAGIIRRIRPDILLLAELDYDAGGAALAAFRQVLAEGPEGLLLPYRYQGPGNSGWPSGLDLDGDGTSAGPDDAWGWGRFEGQGAMALLSRWPVSDEGSRSFRKLLWRDLPGAQMPVTDTGAPFPNAAVAERLRLSSRSHWDLEIETPAGPLRILAAHPTPPVFDGPEDRNGLRNHDEIAFFNRYLSGVALTDDAGREAAFAGGPFVLMGTLNADPVDGEARREALAELLGEPSLQDPRPASRGAVEAAREQGGANERQLGPAALDTADWRDEDGPGNLRADYVLPSAGLEVLDAGVFWPAPVEDGHALVGDGSETVSSDHRLVWVDIALP